MKLKHNYAQVGDYQSSIESTTTSSYLETKMWCAKCRSLHPVEWDCVGNVHHRDAFNCVYVEYYDVVGKIETWATAGEAIEWASSDIGLNKVVGWVIETNDKYLLIGSHKADNPNGDDQWGQLTRIPRGIITKQVNLLPEK